MQGWRYLPSLLPGCIAIAGNLLGDYWAWSNVIFTLGLLPLLDLVGPAITRSSPIKNATIPNLVLLLGVLLHTTAIATLLWGVGSGMLTGSSLWGAIIGTGLNAGVNGITVAHELIHRKAKGWRWLGIWNLLLVNYPHFYIEHIRGHHRWVGMPQDAATAKRGESFYRYFIRTLPGQWTSALRLAAKSAQQKGYTPFGIHNFVLRVAIIQISLIIALWLICPWVAFAYLLQSFVAIFLLETVNYGEHYGLVRLPGERFSHDHAWQSDSITSRLTLIELSRHADHHIKASKPYHTLESHEESPRLPVGYFAMFYLLILPPLWFYLVDPLLDKYPAGAKERRNFS